jgi:hypothetical protein
MIEQIDSFDILHNIIEHNDSFNDGELNTNIT